MNHELIYTRIGGIIKDRRKILGMTQENLSERLGISRASLANIETGRQNFPVHQLYNIAKALKLSPTDLLPSIVHTTSKSFRTALPLPPGLNSQQREQITSLIENVSSETTEQKELTNVKQAKSK